MTRPLLVADLFAGAGGFDEGARQALSDRGLEMRLLAVNHWQTALDTHELNHPEARRICVDVYKTTPREAIPGGELDLLIASPTCIHFSRAKGGRPISWDQRKGRMTPTQVYRWCKELKVRVLLVENVPEFKDWGPICKRTTRCKEHAWDGPRASEPNRTFCGKQIRAKKGVNFRGWIRRLRKLGFKLDWRVLKAADFGDATTRERFFLIGRTDGAPITWPEPTHSRDGSAPKPGLKLRRWRPARKVIDWKIRGASIFTRKKPLAPKTLLRILAGVKRFAWPERFVRKLELYLESLGIEVPETEISDQLDLFGPSVLVMRNHADMRSIEAPLPTVVAGGTHLGLVEPSFTFPLNQGKERARGLRSVDVPLGTITATGTDLGLVEPLVVRTAMPRSNSKCYRGASEPLPAVTTDGGLAVVEPFVLNRHGDNNGGTGSQRGRSVDAPLPTPTASGAGYLVEPFLLPQHFGAPARSVDLPAPPPVAVNRTGLVAPFVFANRTNNVPKSIDGPVPTNTTCGGGGIGLVQPFVLSQGAGGAPRSVEDPVPSIPTDGAHAFVVPVTHTDPSNRARSVDEPLPTVTGANRGELAFVAAAFGERSGQAARVHSVEEPVPTICAKGRVPLVEGFEDLSDVDILFRMLEPHELAAAMSFPRRYRFRGNKTQKTRQIGNAVPVRVARALVAAILGAAA